MALSVYVAWPAGGDGAAGDERARRAVLHALERQLAPLPRARLVSVLIDGAGTPSAASVGVLLARLGRHLEIEPDFEVTLALDAQAAAAPALADYRRAGITRLSVPGGALGAAAEATLRAATALFARTAIDLTFPPGPAHGPKPDRSRALWCAALARALQLGIGHVSIEEHGSDDPVDPDDAAACYQLALERLSAGGLRPYEIAHFARAGQESRQLLHGARGGDYLGIGPGAVGRVTIGNQCHALAQVEAPAAWLQALEGGADGIAERSVLTPEERLIELLLTGLRLRAGIERAWFEPLVGSTLEAALPADRLDLLIGDGFVLLDETGLRLTERGWPLCDGVLARLLA